MDRCAWGGKSLRQALPSLTCHAILFKSSLCRSRTAPGVDHPVAVRFAWHKLAEPNLMNREGLPAVPFRAGEVPQRDLPK